MEKSRQLQSTSTPISNIVRITRNKKYTEQSHENSKTMGRSKRKPTAINDSKDVSKLM